MSRTTLLGGLGGLAFGVLSIVALFLAKPVGGNYVASDTTKYVASGHRAAVFIAAYLMLVATFGLVCLLARLRQAIGGTADEQTVVSSVFWGSGLAAAAASAIGWCLNLAPPMTYAYAGDGFALSPPQIYAITEIGSIVLLGVGGVLLGAALISLFFGEREALPAWFRWLTLIAGIIGLASFGFFPWFALPIWSIVAGFWLLASGRAGATA